MKTRKTWITGLAVTGMNILACAVLSLAIMHESRWDSRIARISSRGLTVLTCPLGWLLMRPMVTDTDEKEGHLVAEMGVAVGANALLWGVAAAFIVRWAGIGKPQT